MIEDAADDGELEQTYGDQDEVIEVQGSQRSRHRMQEPPGQLLDLIPGVRTSWRRSVLREEKPGAKPVLWGLNRGSVGCTGWTLGNSSMARQFARQFVI